MCENLSRSFDAIHMENEIKAFSNFLYSSSIGYKYTRSYLEQQFKNYVKFREQAVNCIKQYRDVKDKLSTKKSELESLLLDAEIELVINGIFKINLSNDIYKLKDETKWEESDFYSEAKTEYFFKSADILSILSIIEFNTKKIYRYFEFNVKEDFDNKINEMINVCKKIIDECRREVNEK